MINFVILGPPGSGKGTQARIISQKFSLDVVDTGKLLRNYVVSDEELLRNINLGNLLSDDLVIRIVEDHVLRLSKNFILDGFPRTIAQANSLIRISSAVDKSINCVVRLELDDEVIIKRLSTRFICASCGAIFKHDLLNCTECQSDKIEKRDDDSNLDAINHRILQYRKEFLALDQFFSSLNIKVLVVDAAREVDQVTKDIQKELF